jgi:DNA (cytosine-5)-methyltransferase 1
MRAVELFCGIGMSALGLDQAGADVVGAVDIDKRFVYSFNIQNILPANAQLGDVGDYEPPPMDLLSGGPVCKAFSPGATLFGTSGKNDPRNTFPLFFKVLKRCSPLPSYVLIENSYGLARFKGYVSELKKQLQRLGYVTDIQEIDCYDYGVPQHRRRLVFTASLRHGVTPWKVTKPAQRTGPKTVGDCFGNTSEELLRDLTPGSLAYLLRDPIHLKKHKPLTLDRTASTVVGNYKRGVPYGVVEKNGVYYRCMPRLAARLQGLPDSYDLTHLSVTAALEGIGNGFPTPVVKHLVKDIV